MKEAPSARALPDDAAAHLRRAAQARPPRAATALARGLRRAGRALAANPKVAAGSSVVGFFLLVAFLGPVFIRQNPNTFTNFSQQPPTAAHWLGTTLTGQDVFSQLVVGTRSSVLWGFGTGLAVVLISMVVGLVGGYFGGAVDDVLTVLTNVFLVIPGLPLAIVLASYFARGPLTVALVITVTSWAWGARVLRAQTLSLRSREFVTAARAGGETAWRIIAFEIFPNEISIVAANFVSTVLYVILASASLEFLGLGDSNSVSWGIMLYSSYSSHALIIGTWWWFIPPGLCIAMLGAGLALINFGIDEVADPRLRRERPARRATTRKAVA